MRIVMAKKKDDKKDKRLDNLIPWLPGQSGNPAGRPPKLLTEIGKEMQEAGYQRVTAENVREAYELILAMDEETIKGMVEDKSTPMIMRIVGKKMMGAKGMEAIETMLDRVHGKARQQAEVKIDGKVVIDWSDD
jgi:hypothetical protein